MGDAKALLILHGKQALNDEVREAVKQRREAGWDLAVRVTWGARRCAAAGARGAGWGYPTLIAGGGDGTLHEVGAAMLEIQADASLALLPLGSANDFAKAAGIPLDPVEALGLLEQPAQVIDIGAMNGHPFVNMATGASAQRSPRAPPRSSSGCWVAAPICSPA